MRRDICVFGVCLQSNVINLQMRLSKVQSQATYKDIIICSRSQVDKVTTLTVEQTENTKLSLALISFVSWINMCLEKRQKQSGITR